MLPTGLGDGYHPTRSSSRSSIPMSIRGEACDHLRRGDRQITAEPPTQARNARTRILPSAARTFLQRTLARVLRQPKQTSQRSLISPPRRALALDKGPLTETSDTSPCLAGRDHFASLTPLVLQRTDDVAFSPSSFFRRVEEIRGPDSVLGDPLAPSQLLPERRPPSGPHRRPPPPVNEASDLSMTCTSSSLPRNPTSPRPQTTHRKQPPKSELHSVPELQTLAMELDKLDPLLVKSPPPPSAPQCLQTSPTIKSLHPRPRLWSTSPLAARNLSRDPLAELLAVADELKTMKNLDSDDILYMTDAAPPSPLPPTLHAFLDAPGASLHILEMDVHREDETFLGVPIPCIVVTSEGDSLLKAKLEIQDPPPLPSEDLLAPPPATYRGRVETDQPPIITDGDSERSPTPSPSLTLPLCEDTDTVDGDEVTGGSLSLPCYCPACALGDENPSWEVIGMARTLEPSAQCTKPGRPIAPKPMPLLRRRERSLLRRILGGGDGCNAPLVEKDTSGCIPSKRKRKRISKDTIGSPRPLSLAGQMT